MSDTKIEKIVRPRNAIISSQFKREYVLNLDNGYTPQVNDLVCIKTGKASLFTDEATVVPMGVIENYNADKKVAVIAGISYSETASLRYGKITNAANSEDLLRTYNIHLNEPLTVTA